MLTEFRPATEDPDIDRRMMRVASEYVRFAEEHPHLFTVMNGPTLDPDERRRAVQPGIDVLKELLAVWSDAHGVPLAEPKEACEIIWGVLYDIATLGHLSAVGNERARRLAGQALHAILLGWRTDSAGMDGLPVRS
jgi:hypothetical protein